MCNNINDNIIIININVCNVMNNDILMCMCM